MNKILSWKEQRELLFWTINKISLAWGGDDSQWLDNYCNDIVETHKLDLDKALECFKDLQRITIATGRVIHAATNNEAVTGLYGGLRGTVQ